MPVFSRFQMRKKWALFDANQFPQPLAVVSAITFARVVFFTVCLFAEKSAKIASKFIFDFHSVSRENVKRREILGGSPPFPRFFLRHGRASSVNL